MLHACHSVLILSPRRLTVSRLLTVSAVLHAIIISCCASHIRNAPWCCCIIVATKEENSAKIKTLWLTRPGLVQISRVRKKRKTLRYQLLFEIGGAPSKEASKQAEPEWPGKRSLLLLLFSLSYIALQWHCCLCCYFQAFVCSKNSLPSHARRGGRKPKEPGGGRAYEFGKKKCDRTCYFVCVCVCVESFV